MSFICQAQDNIVQGPFSLDKNLIISFVKERNKSISLVAKCGKNRKVIDNYNVYDGILEIKTVFFIFVDKVKNAAVLVSWNEGNISAIRYKVFFYRYDRDELVINRRLTNDENLSGYDGYGSSGLIFYYKDSDSISNYIKEKYK
ncbi:hypothetical protein TI10_15225 [Photorhabdus luminescens subsp. luminescens]|uniref:Uncharacterized protein n=1 Tax=Photorhabdus luminescens TaxID=29488 RepID=A0A1G5RHA0_PHOLU|nr:hypothetical protein [Photorhabdus luminescens]KMW72316.1 hypothetical protein TI10_15225 [Photorhabdus luminescens subsp. luminescens]SCZ72741.1 hypothetical protein SAMN02982990_04111 [Photorhabdus luminescens]